MPLVRTVIGDIIQGQNGKFSVQFDNIMSHMGEEYVGSSITSPAHFDTADLAIVAGHRAIDVLIETGKFPNMCEPF